MKKSTALAAVPVAIALLSLGVPGKSMATDIAVPVAVASHGSEATAVSAQDNLNTKDSNNTEYNAKAVNGSVASNTGDATNIEVKKTSTSTSTATKGNATASLLAVVGDITLNASVAALSNAVSGNTLAFGNDLENENGFIANHNRSSNIVSLDTGKNSISGTITANGITPIAMNTGIQSSIQQQVNVQAFAGKSGN